MNREQKTTEVAALNEAFSTAPMVILTDYVGSTVGELESLRRACGPAGARFKVVKNTLARRALQGTELEGLTAHFKGNVGVLFAGEDAIAAAKVFKNQAKTNGKLTCKAGFFEGDILDAPGVAAVASLPSREELLAQLLNTALAAPRKVLTMLQAPSRDLLYLLKNYENKLEG